MGTKSPQVVQVPEDEYERQKREIRERAVEYEVIGANGIRDCVSREVVPPGGIVRLDPQVPGNALLVRARAVRPAKKAENAAGGE